MSGAPRKIYDDERGYWQRRVDAGWSALRNDIINLFNGKQKVKTESQGNPLVVNNIYNVSEGQAKQVKTKFGLWGTTWRIIFLLMVILLTVEIINNPQWISDGFNGMREFFHSF